MHTVPRHGSGTDAPQRLGAALIPPDVRAVLPLRPAPLGTPDGTDHNAGDRHAAKRVVVTRRQDHPHRKCLVTEDRLRSKAPHSETRPHHDLPDILGGKAGDHALLCQQRQAAAPAGRVTDDARHDRAAGVIHRWRLVTDGPLKAATVDVRVHGLESWEMGDATVQHFSWVTDLRVRQRNVFHLMRGGRARWTLANDTCKTLKTQGDHVAHPYGHGEPHLSGVFARLRMLAWLVDQTQPLCCALLQAVWAKRGSQRLRWERMRAWLYDDAVASMRQRFEALWSGVKKSSPLVTLASASSPSMAGVTSCHHTR